MSQLADITETTAAQEAERYARIVESARIAIIDDEVVNIEVVQAHLEQEGYSNFLRTTDARKALDLIRLEQPDIVLLDVMMPETSGLEILAAMRADDRMRHIPVIVLTANTAAETKIEALQLGSTDFLGKPVDASELLLRIRNVLSVKVYQDHLADLVAVQKDLLDRTFTGAVCMLTDIIETIESPAVGSSELRSVAEKLLTNLNMESNWTLPLAARLLVTGLPLLTQNQRDLLTTEPVSSASHRDTVKQMIEISSNLTRRIPRLDPVIAVLDESLSVDGSLSPTDSESRSFATILVTGFYVDLLRRSGRSAETIVKEMQKRFPSIDRTLLASTQNLLGVNQDGPQKGDLAKIKLTPTQLVVGMVVATKATDEQNRLLIAEGRTLTEPMIVRLMQMSETQDIRIEVFVTRS